MAWVRSEYAGELAVVAAWLSALLPWSVSVASRGGISFVVLRWPLFVFQFLFGVNLGAAEQPFLWVFQMPGTAANPTNLQAYYVWNAAAVALGLALVLSVVYYTREEQLEASPVDPVRLMGLLLTVGGVLLLASTVLLWQGFFGTTVPVGAVIVTLLGAMLVRVERTDD
ncbi:DUF7549 family protein [Halorarius litoreus]|uniref:DUF7549 family protein n=1 Tax=Halorarius litoreus TaxID=2962676 RepID=UPI0020CBC1F3|nr:hypothetical protein [Halorarius litoreus]